MSDFGKAAPSPKTALGKHRVLSSKAGIHVSPLILGGMSIGQAWSAFMGSMSKEQAFQLLDAFVDAGGNFIDTANAYQSGESEMWIGDWMKERNNRDHVVIATKYSFHYKADKNVDKSPANNNYWGNHKRSMNMSLRDSLLKLQTDWIDIFYVHWWDFTTSIEEVMDSLHILVLAGKVLYLGISDTPAWVVAAANSYATSHGKTPFSIYQGRWNVLLRDMEREIIPMTLHFGMAIAAWDVLGGGKLASEDQVRQRKTDKDQSRSSQQQSSEEVKVSAALSKIARNHGSESVQAIALAYVRAKAPNVFPLIGGRKIEHLHDNIRGLDLQLTPEEIKFIEDQTKFDIGFPSDFIGQDYHLTGEAGQMLISQGPLVVGK